MTISKDRPRRGDQVCVHLLDGEFAYDGICTSSTKRGVYVVSCSNGHYFKPTDRVRLEVTKPEEAGRRRSFSVLMDVARTLTVAPREGALPVPIR